MNNEQYKQITSQLPNVNHNDVKPSNPQLVKENFLSFKLSYFLMGIGFLCAAFSMVINIINRTGFSTWCWQLTTIVWILDSFLKELRIEKFLKTKI